MMKRLQLTLLSLFVCVCAIASETSFENADGVEIWYNFDVDTKTASVTYMGSNMDSYDDEYTGDLVIPSAIAYKGDVYKVTTIEEYAFYKCSQLSSVTLGKYMVDLDHNPFSACLGLTDIYVVSDNENFTSVDGVLYNKDKTKILIYPKGKKDTSYIILDGVKEIGDGAFNHCKTLTSVTIPSSVTKIGTAAFFNCDALTGIALPSSVTKIGSRAFSNCDVLTSITLPSSVKEIVMNAFWFCSSLKSIYVVSDNENYTSVDGVLYNKDKTKILIYPKGKKDTSYIILEGVKEIGDGAFNDCKTLTNVTIPSSVSKIGSAAFFNCNALTGITLPSSVIEIGMNAFNDCDALASVTIPSSVIEMGDGVFSDCDALTSVTIPNSITKIGMNAFSDCDALTSITIPNSVTEIGLQAFADCDTLTNITIPESVTKIGIAAFSDCDALTNITIPESVTEIEDYVFSDCDALTNIDVDSNNNYFASIDGVLFNKDKTILIQYPKGKEATSYSIPNSVTMIGDQAFRWCANITSVVIPEGVTDIGERTFEHCSNLTNIALPESVTSIRKGTFHYCRSLKNVILPKSITLIDSSAFFNCNGLISVILPEGIASIEAWAFAECEALTSITLPKSITSIGKQAFCHCSSLTSITCKSEIPPKSEQWDIFEGVDMSIPVYVPAESVADYKNSWLWSDFINIQAIDNTPVSDIQTSEVNIRFVGNAIVVDGTDDYTVYSISGQNLGKVTNVDSGIYIIVADGKSYKLIAE